MPASPAHRNNQLAQIHIARAALGMTEDEYRDLLSTKFNGLRSAAHISAQQRQELLHHFQRLGWVGTVGGSRANPAGPAKPKTPWSPGVKKLFSLWQQLADKNLVGNRTAKALSTWCERQTAGADGRGGVARVEWLKPAQLHAVTEQAKRWLARGEQPPAGHTPPQATGQGAAP